MSQSEIGPTKSSAIIKRVFAKEKFGNVNAAVYHFKQKYPEVPLKDVRAYFRKTHLKNYEMKPDRKAMGNKFSIYDDFYQIDIFFEGKNSYLLAVNVNTKYAWCKKVDSKNTDDVLEAFDELNGDLHPRYIECDAEKAFTSIKFVDYLR